MIRRAARLRSALASAALGVSLALASSAARAQGHAPGTWERAADPALALSDRVHEQVGALLLQVFQLHWYSPMGQEQLRRAQRLLEGVRAEISPDVRLRFDFGQVMSLLRDEKRAMAALQSAIVDAPDHPSAINAYSTLAICYAKAGQPEQEIASYDEFLRRETNAVERANALSNRAEALMLLGRLPAAINDYRAALLLEPDSVLAHFGLAVALDRAGDAPGGLTEAKEAVTFDPLDQQLSSPNVFFIPAYDRHWYEGLGSMARAAQMSDAASSVLWWEAAVAQWAGYLAEATDDDRWIPLAKAHLASCRRKLEQAKKRPARVAPPVPDADSP